MPAAQRLAFPADIALGPACPGEAGLPVFQQGSQGGGKGSGFLV